MTTRTPIAIFAACAALAAAAADPVAFVADLKGNATIEGDGRVKFLTELAAGTRLLLGTGATVAVTYASTGSEFTIVGPGEFLVSAEEVRAEKGAAPNRRKVTSLQDAGMIARASQTAAASTRMRSIAAEPSHAVLLYPVNTRVASLQPELRWQSRPAPGHFTVIVADESGRELWKGDAAETAAKPGIKLTPATRYKWTVMTPKGVLGEASFETLSAEAAGRIEKSRAAAKSFSDRVLHAFLLQEQGAVQDARAAWAALARERPDLPELSGLAR